jgi:catechol 2,3-dioxygenase-like lactoylglutathione lyase family enzyme
MKKLSLLSGIQQVGVGVTDAEEAWSWYRNYFGMDVPLFKDSSTAALMTRYTGGDAWKRYAILALNMQGGGGFEIWQFTDRTPQKQLFVPQPGDLGIFGVLMKCRDVEVAQRSFKKRKLEASDLFQGPDGGKRFYLIDPYGNRFTFTGGLGWFGKGNHTNGGITGVQIGVSEMNRSLKFYREVLGFDQIVSDQTGMVHEYGKGSYRRVLLRPESPFGGAFSKLLGPAEIELVQALDYPARKLYEDRFWGDPGFIHVCFDVNNMETLEMSCNEKGFPFTVNSKDSFDMGQAAGHFSYTEDPDGTLIEFVQTHRIPIMKKIGWYLDLRKRDVTKPLPKWLLATLKLQRVKD